MLAIQTKYLPRTAQRGPRVRASAIGASAILHWDDTLLQEQNHYRAAQAVAFKLGYTHCHTISALPDGTYIHLATNEV